MISSELTKIDSIIIHKVGNKSIEEGITFSNTPISTNENINQLLLTYFLTPFKSNEYYNFYHDSDLQMNELYNFSTRIFENPDSLYEESKNIARHLYNRSVHPKIKEGELYIVYLQDCVLDGEVADAIGIFKSENLETYLKVYPKNEGYEITADSGININKLDKGCLIFNTEPEKGYLVAVADNLKKSSEAQYWKDDFLNIKRRNDDYLFTQKTIEVCKNFITEQLPEEFEVNKADQAEILNKSAEFFKEKDNFELNEFAEEIFQQPEIVDSFTQYKSSFENDNENIPPNDFSISDKAVKKQARFFKSVIKLDKNFHIYVHGKREYIVRGKDPESGMNYYKLLFHEEE